MLHPVFQIPELLHRIIGFDTRGKFRAVSKWLKESWDFVHKCPKIFRYEMLTEPRQAKYAAACLSYLQRFSHNPRCGIMWSIPVPPQYFSFMSRVLQHQFNVVVQQAHATGWAHIFLTPDTDNSTNIAVDVVHSHRTSLTMIEFSGRTFYSAVPVLRDIGRYLCFNARLKQASAFDFVLAQKSKTQIAVMDPYRPNMGDILLSGPVIETGKVLITKINCKHPFVSECWLHKVYTFNNDGYVHRTQQVSPVRHHINKMPKSLEHDKAVKIINSRGLSQVGAKFPNAVIFEQTDTLKHVPVGNRTLVCVFDKDGNNKTPIDESKSYHSTDIIVGVNVDRCFMGPATTFKNEMSMTACKQSAYTRAIPNDGASQKFFQEMFRVYSPAVYAEAVNEHAMHAAKQGKLFKDKDAIKGIQALVRKNKLHTPIAEDEDGKPIDIVMRRKVFSARHAWKETDSDYDQAIGVKEFCEEQGPKTRTGNCCVDPVPMFYADGSRVKSYDSVRGSSAAIVVYSLRGDWYNESLGNLSFPHELSYMQCLSVSLSQGAVVVTAPNLLDDEDTAVDLTDTVNEDTESEEDAEDADAFVSKRRKLTGD